MATRQSRHKNAAGMADGLLLLLVLGACSPLASQTPQPDEKASAAMSDTGIAQVIARNADSIMALTDVVAVSESRCNNQPCIKILLAAENADTRARLPETIEGIPVVIEVSGSFFANPE